jgi:hypothetical protein
LSPLVDAGDDRRLGGLLWVGDEEHVLLGELFICHRPGNQIPPAQPGKDAALGRATVTPAPASNGQQHVKAGSLHIERPG